METPIEQAAVFRRYPFTIILKEACTTEPTPVRIKVDPGSKTTGIAMVSDATGHVVWAAELTLRGQQIRDDLQSRRARKRRASQCTELCRWAWNCAALRPESLVHRGRASG